MAIKQEKWCPTCVGKKKGTIEDMIIIANRQGGDCLSKIYTNYATKLLWECSKGHRWGATPNSIKRGRSKKK